MTSVLNLKEFQDIHTEVSRNQSKYTGLKFRAVKTRDTDLRVFSIDGNDYSVTTVRYTEDGNLKSQS